MNEKKDLFTDQVLSFYLKKWEDIALSTEPVVSVVIKDLVKDVYKLIKVKKCNIGTYNYTTETHPVPQNILILDNPFKSFSVILDVLYQRKEGIIQGSLLKRVYNLLGKQLDFGILTQSRQKLFVQLESKLDKTFYHPFKKQLEYLSCKQPESDLVYLSLYNFLDKNYFLWPSLCCWIDFCISELDCIYPEREWLLFQSIAKQSGWTFLFEETAIICQRPRSIVEGGETYWPVWDIKSELNDMFNYKDLL